MFAGRWFAVICLFTSPFAVALKLRGELEHVTQTDSSEELGDPRCPSMFVAIISRPESRQQRDQIREMWQRANEDWGDVKAKFMLCTQPGLSDEVLSEQEQNEDMLFMDCVEGYKNGILTRKVATAMQTYLDDYSNFDLFMKIDDDTFMSARRICNLLSWRAEQGKDNRKVYMGVFAEGDREALMGKHIPNRDPSSVWYEPLEKFDGPVYPVSAKGGPGYILARPLVENIIYRGIAETNELNNEDKAIGVWVDKLLQKEVISVDFVNIPGTDGYDEHKDSITTAGTYKRYPHFLHHHLPGNIINCLFKVDAKHDPDARIDPCFKPP